MCLYKRMAVVAAGMLIGLSLPAAAAETGAASAATYTTEDGILTMSFPTADWVVEEDSLSWFTLTNGKDLITGDHYAAGEARLEAVLTGDSSGYGAVYQTVLVTENEWFVLRGYAADKGENLEELQQIIGSARVLHYDSITAILQEEEEAPAPAPTAIEEEFRAAGTITARSLNVRSSAAADAPVLGELAAGDTVEILGKVTDGATGSEWMKISYNGETAYVSAGYVALGEAQEEIPVEEAEDFEEIALYGVNGDVVKVTRPEAGSSVWTDAKGITYERSGKNPEVMVDDNGDYWATSNSYWDSEDLEIIPEEEEMSEASEEEYTEEEEEMVTEVRLEGTDRDVTVYRNGESFYDVNGMEYWFVGSRMWKNENDEMFYEP